MTIQFNITEPMPCTRNVWLTLENGNGKRIRYAEPADVLAAIGANPELRTAVLDQLRGEYPAVATCMVQALASAEKERDDWKSRAEKAETAARSWEESATANEKARAALYAELQDARAAVDALTATDEDLVSRPGAKEEAERVKRMMLDTVADVRIQKAESSLREAERERDFQRDCRHREERELGAARERLVSIIDEAFGLQPVIEGRIDDVLTALESRLFAQRKRCAEHLSKAERERDEARAAFDKLQAERRDAFDMLDTDLMALACGGNPTSAEAKRVQSRIAKLERELAEARADLSLQQQCAKHWLDAHNRLERELATVHDTDAAPWNMTRGDALELQARRALDEWERETPAHRRVGIDSRGRLVADSAGLHEYAPNHVDLARRLGLLGGEGAGEK